ncbi:MAG: NAD-dependent epimerase/dehydratase family protein [Pseudomonadota bacterium]
MSGTVLIAGASGLVGSAAGIAFLQAGWDVVAVARRPPELIEAMAGRAPGRYTHLPIDLRDPQGCRDAAARLGAVTHVIYAAVYEMPGLVEGWTDPHQIETNGRMIRNLMEPLADSARLEHVTLLQGTKAYGGHFQPMRVPAREDRPRVEHPNFYWLHEDFVREQSAQRGYAFTIFRPQLIVGPNHGVVMNLPPVIGLYAAIRRAEGKPFSFPGGAEWVWEAVDTRLIARAALWAARAPEAANETFNLTNGEVFSFRDMWPAMARTLGVETGPDEPISLARYLPEREDLWRAIVAEHGLRDIPMTALLGESHHYADLCFAYGAEQPPAPTYLSTVKIKQAGFTDTWNTEESFCYWLNDLMDRRILPPA